MGFLVNCNELPDVMAIILMAQEKHLSSTKQMAYGRQCTYIFSLNSVSLTYLSQSCQGLFFSQERLDKNEDTTHL